MDELTENAEEPDEGESKQSEIKLGKLQYKVRLERWRLGSCDRFVSFAVGVRF